MYIDATTCSFLYVSQNGIIIETIQVVSLCASAVSVHLIFVYGSSLQVKICVQETLLWTKLSPFILSGMLISYACKFVIAEYVPTIEHNRPTIIIVVQTANCKMNHNKVQLWISYDIFIQFCKQKRKKKFIFTWNFVNLPPLMLMQQAHGRIRDCHQAEQIISQNEPPLQHQCNCTENNLPLALQVKIQSRPSPILQSNT